MRQFERTGLALVVMNDAVTAMTTACGVRRDDGACKEGEGKDGEEESAKLHLAVPLGCPAGPTFERSGDV